MKLIMLASVVLLPEPVGPVTRNNPRGRMQSLAQTAGSAQLLHRQQLVRNLPQHHRDVAALLEDGDAEAGQIAEREAEVAAADLRQLMLAAVGRDALHQGDRVVRLEHLGLQPPHPAVHAEHRRLAHRDVDVAGALLDAGHQQLVDEDIAHTLNRTARRRLTLAKRIGEEEGGPET